MSISCCERAISTTQLRPVWPQILIASAISLKLYWFTSAAKMFAWGNTERKAAHIARSYVAIAKPSAYTSEERRKGFPFVYNSKAGKRFQPECFAPARLARQACAHKTLFYTFYKQSRAELGRLVGRVCRPISHLCLVSAASFANQSFVVFGWEGEGSAGRLACQSAGIGPSLSVDWPIQ